MNFYHWWIYEHLLNARWFIWTVVVVVFIFNILGPVLIWFRINSKPLPFLKKGKKKQQQQDSSSPGDG